MPTEVCASSYRAKGVGIATVNSRIWNFVVGLITPTLVAHSHAYGAFFFFAGWLVLAFVWAYFFVPETKGISLEGESRLLGLESVKEVNVDDAIQRWTRNSIITRGKRTSNAGRLFSSS